jgi:hypothetical protein
MKKEHREIVKLAEREGVQRPKILGGTPHSRLIGHVGGVPISVVVSATKAAATAHNLRCTKANIRKAVAQAQKAQE